jgi:hypothetical protein
LNKKLQKMKNLFTVLFLIFTTTTIAQIPAFDWAKGIGASNGDYGRSIATDNDANVYTTGSFQSNVDFDPGNGTFNLSSNGSRDIYIQKLDSAGNFIWAKSIGGVGNDEGYSIDVDKSNNIYITGIFSLVVDFDPGVNILNLSSMGGYDMFILKLDSAGNFIWAKSIGGTGDDFSNSIVLDSAFSIYTTGRYRSTVDFNPGPMTNNMTSTGFYDLFCLKLDSTGNYIWSKSVGGNTNGTSITIDFNQNVYMTGDFGGTVDFDPGTNIYNISSFGSNDIFVLKLDSSGNFIWANGFGSKTNDYGNDIVVDLDGSLYFLGTYQDTADFNPTNSVYNLISKGSHDIFICKLDTNGNFTWAKSVGGVGLDQAFSLTKGLNQEIQYIGTFSATADFDPSANTLNLISNGTQDIFIASIDGDLGTSNWAIGIGSSGNDYGYDLIADNSGNIFSTGIYAGIADFDHGISNVTLPVFGAWDAFVHKLKPVVISGIENYERINEVIIYPNPAITKFKIVTTDKIGSTIQVYNSIGKLVYSNLIYESRTVIDATDIGGKGMYILNIIDRNTQVISTNKLIVE